MTDEPGAPTDAIPLPGTGAAPWGYTARHVRPHLHPVTTPAGHVLSRDAPRDHPWHHGLWFTIKYVDGENFWEQVEPFGTLRHVGDPTLDGAGLAGDIDWVRPAGGVALRQSVRIRAVDSTDADATAVDIDVSLTTDADVLLDRTPFTTWGGYGGLAFRGRPDMVDSVITLADGSSHDRVLGVRSSGFDLSGHVGDERAGVGVTVLDGTSPGDGAVPWYGSCRSSTYGDEGWSNFFNAAFLWDGPLVLEGGQVMTFAYRVVAHDGLGDADRMRDEARRYAASRRAGP